MHRAEIALWVFLIVACVFSAIFFPVYFAFAKKAGDPVAGSNAGSPVPPDPPVSPGSPGSTAKPGSPAKPVPPGPQPRKVYSYVEKRVENQKLGCELKNAAYASLNPNRKIGDKLGSQLLENECSGRDDCVGYYANGQNRGGWINSTDTLPAQCPPKSDTKETIGVSYFWTKTPEV
jgi:hypothetical protein